MNLQNGLKIFRYKYVQTDFRFPLITELMGKVVCSNIPGTLSLCMHKTQNNRL